MAIQSKPRAPHGATEVGAEADSGVHHEDFPALVTLDVSYRRITVDGVGLKRGVSHAKLTTRSP